MEVRDASLPDPPTTRDSALDVPVLRVPSSDAADAGSDTHSATDAPHDAGSDTHSMSDAPHDAGFIDACGRPVAAKDVTCEEDTDCTIYRCTSCGDTLLVGVNDASTFFCIPPPCPPPEPPPPGEQLYGYTTENCDFTTSYSSVGVKCIDGQCRTELLSP
jgi:hypothetical protein